MIYSIAGITVEFKFKYRYGELKCQRYLFNGTPAMSFSASDEEIEREKELFPENTLESAEFDCLFRKLYNIAPKYNRIVMHGASIMKDGKGFIFAAPSGTGKTTHIKLWGRRFGNEVKVIDGDKPFVSFENGSAFVWGSPRSGKENLNNPLSAPLSGIAFIERGKENSIAKVSPQEIFNEAFMQFYFPKNKEMSEKTVEIINGILSNVPLYRLRCNTDVEAAEVAWNGMK